MTVIETVTESVRRTEGIVTRTEKESVRRRENERRRRRGNVRGKERRNEKEKKSEKRKENVKGRGRRSGSEETRRIATDLHLNPPEGKKAGNTNWNMLVWIPVRQEWQQQKIGTKYLNLD